MSKKAAYCDVDGTLTSGFYIKELCDALYKCGLFSGKEYMKSEDILSEYKKGNLKYTEAAPEAVKVFARGIRGRKKIDAQKVGEIYIAEHPEKIFTFTEGLISKLRYKGYIPVLLSGSPEEIIMPFGRGFGICEKDIFATQFEAERGVYTGEVLRSMVEPGMKRSIAKSYAEMHGIDLAESAAFEDTENGVELLDIVGHPIAIRPNSILEEIAIKREWPICKTDEEVRETVKYIP